MFQSPESPSVCESLNNKQPGVRTHPGHISQDGDSQDQETDPLFLSQLNHLHEPHFVRGEDASNASVIPAQDRLTHHIIRKWNPFKDLKLTFVQHIITDRNVGTLS